MALFPKPSLQRFLSVPSQYVHLPLLISLASLMHVLPAGGLAWDEICMDALANILSLQSNWNIVIICPALPMGNLLTEVLPLCGVLTFLKAGGSPSLQT